jgi:hypothetical protein
VSVILFYVFDNANLTGVKTMIKWVKTEGKEEYKHQVANENARLYVSDWKNDENKGYFQVWRNDFVISDCVPTIQAAKAAAEDCLLMPYELFIKDASDYLLDSLAVLVYDIRKQRPGVDIIGEVKKLLTTCKQSLQV